ncbi:hypothetical protein OWR29_20345 [Actinoplanes sp. Pm04-4]|uniref:Uncharacterized protein n=1 Tax=Paractinoplanes pyxinae TaxID=2997416 RepID=A0ABT4B1K1_9ACTN|nr:hypothetical protein [Actinoplanes pyxinae]MCY1140356.1 hypothetical protein [Actinoplanes pyxinae]
MAFPPDERIHRQPDDPARRGPARRRQVGLRGSGQHEAARPRVIVHRPFDGAQNLGRQLPLVDQDRFGEPAKCGVGVSTDHGSLRGNIEPQNRTGVTARCRRLAAGAGADDEGSGMSSHDGGEFRVEQSADVSAQHDSNPDLAHMQITS